MPRTVLWNSPAADKSGPRIQGDWRIGAPSWYEKRTLRSVPPYPKFPAMIKLKGLALITAMVFAVTSAYAGEKSCCAAHTADGKMHCAQSYAKLNLSPDQKVKLEKLEAQCHKAGCTKESMDKFMKSAKGILSKEQYETLKAEHVKMHDKAKA